VMRERLRKALRQALSRRGGPRLAEEPTEHRRDQPRVLPACREASVATVTSS
jgi:hypothetical protein